MGVSGKKGRELLRLRRNLARAEQALTEVDRRLLAPNQLCASDFEILERLTRKGSRPVNTLARRVGLTSGSMTTAVQRLLRRDLVETRRDTKDKRVVHVSITPEGAKLTNQISATRLKLLAEVFGDWSGREQAVLTAFLKRLRKDAGVSPSED